MPGDGPAASDPSWALGGVAGEKVEAVVFQGNQPPLLIQRLHTQAILDR